MLNHMHVSRLTVAAIALGFTVGCAALDLKSPKSWFPADDDKPQPPGSITAVWSPALLERADGTRARGFGGRLMFYGDKPNTPVRVDGHLVVYAYDDERGGQNARPSRKYVFTREQFATHYSKSDLGPSYSVWIPWDHVDTVTKRVSLIARFNPVEGSPVVSQQAQITLPGTNAPPIENRGQWTSPPVPTFPPAALPVHAISHQAPVLQDLGQPEGLPPADGQMATTTIRIPSRAQQR